jgi:ketosteroid isomerase-like protein
MQLVKPVIVSALIAMGGCAGSRSDPGADQATLRAGTKGWLEAYNQGDVDHIMSLYASDAVVMPPHAPAVTGREALRAFLVSDTAGARSAGVRLVDGASDAGTSGDMGWHSGSFTVVDKKGMTVDSGHYLETWRKTDGKWLIVRDLWNSDRPVSKP